MRRQLRLAASLDSYTEISPSGTGVHILALGTLPLGRRKAGPVEMYADGRYFTMTGQQVADTPNTLNKRTPELAALHRQTFPPAASAAAVSRPPAVPPLHRDDATLLERTRQASNGTKFDALWHGDNSGSKPSSGGAMATPNLMVESSADEVGEMMAGSRSTSARCSGTLSPARARVDAGQRPPRQRAGGGQGGAAPDFTFATIYRLRRWRNGHLEQVHDGSRALPASTSAGTLLGGQESSQKQG